MSMDLTLHVLKRNSVTKKLLYTHIDTKAFFKERKLDRFTLVAHSSLIH